MLIIIYAHAVGRERQNISVVCSRSRQPISIKLARKVGHFVRDLDLDFANVHMA